MDPNDDDVTIEALVRAFSPQNYQSLEVEIQEVTQNQGLFRIGLKHEKLHLKN